VRGRDTMELEKGTSEKKPSADQSFHVRSSEMLTGTDGNTSKEKVGSRKNTGK